MLHGKTRTGAEPQPFRLGSTVWKPHELLRRRFGFHYKVSVRSLRIDRKSCFLNPSWHVLLPQSNPLQSFHGFSQQVRVADASDLNAMTLEEFSCSITGTLESLWGNPTRILHHAPQAYFVFACSCLSWRRSLRASARSPAMEQQHNSMSV